MSKLFTKKSSISIVKNHLKINIKKNFLNLSTSFMKKKLQKRIKNGKKNIEKNLNHFCLRHCIPARETNHIQFLTHNKFYSIQLPIKYRIATDHLMRHRQQQSTHGHGTLYYIFRQICPNHENAKIVEKKFVQKFNKTIIMISQRDFYSFPFS